MSSDVMFSLKGQTALVTGSTSGLGFAVAQLFAKAGAQVLINGRAGSTVATAVEAINDDGGSAIPCVFDVSDRVACAAAFDGIKSEYRSLDILVNNVGLRDRRPLLILIPTRCSAFLTAISLRRFTSRSLPVNK